MKHNVTTLDELVDLAHQGGGVSIGDLRQWLPIEKMTVEDISHVLVRLDEAGFDLEIDPTTLLSAGGTPLVEVSTPHREQIELQKPISRLKKEPEFGLLTSSGRPPAAGQTVRSFRLSPHVSLGARRE